MVVTTAVRDETAKQRKSKRRSNQVKIKSYSSLMYTSVLTPFNNLHLLQGGHC